MMPVRSPFLETLGDMSLGSCATVIMALAGLPLTWGLVPVLVIVAAASYYRARSLPHD